MGSGGDIEGDAEARSARFFGDSRIFLLVPPAGCPQPLVEFCKSEIETWKAAEEGDKKKEHKDGDADTETTAHFVRRHNLLQGELFCFAVFILPVIEGDPTAFWQGGKLGGGTGRGRRTTTFAEWCRKYSTLKAHADLVETPETQDGQAPAGPSSSMAPPPRQAVSALSSQLWEAQAFPINTADGVVLVLHTLEGLGLLFEFQMPLTVNPLYLERDLQLHVTLSASLPSPHTASLVGGEETWDTSEESSDGTEEEGERRRRPAASPVSIYLQRHTEKSLQPSSAVLAASGVKIYDTEALQESLQAPTTRITAGTTPFSSGLTGGLYTGNLLGSLYNPGTYSNSLVGVASGVADPKTANMFEEGSSDIENPLSRQIELLTLAVASPAYYELVQRLTDASPVEARHEVSTSFVVRRPLKITTALLDALMYVQVENTSEDTCMTIEDVHIRSINTHTQGDLPVDLNTEDQHALLLYLDEELLTSQALRPTWDELDHTSTGDEFQGGRGRGAKKVLPLCVKWKIAGTAGPSVWSQFGADCQVPLRTPIEVTLTSVCTCKPGSILTVVLSVANHEDEDVQLAVYLPKDLQYHKGLQARQFCIPNAEVQGALQDPPPLVPLLTKRDLGVIPPGSSQSTHLQFHATRQGLHSLPPAMIVDTRRHRRFLARGGQVVVN